MLKRTAITVAIALTLSGCLSVPKGQRGNSFEDTMAEIETLKKASENSQKNQRIQIKDGPLMTGKRIPLRRYPWLADKRIDLKLNRPVSGHEIVRMLHERGLNITSVMPLDSFTYAGYGFNSVDAETALRLIFPAMGLDYSVDNERRIITIVPMRSKTWTLNITPGKNSSYTSSSMEGSMDVGASLAQSLNQASQGGSSGSTMQKMNGQGNDSGRQGDSKIESKSKFWESLRAELESRVSVLMPVQSGMVSSSMPIMNSSGQPMEINGMPPLPLPGGSVPTARGGSSSGSAGDIYKPQQLGRVAVNPDTGSVTVQGPHWLIDEIDEYMAGVEREFNTSIHFEGRLILVTTTREKSEGLDLTAFASLANGKLGMIINSNPVGGIILSGGQAIGNPVKMTTGSKAIGTTGLGFTKLKGNPANLFINYLSTIGDVKVTQRPMITTTSGTPAEVSRIETDLFSQVSQESVAGNYGGGSVATRNTQIPIRFGTLLRVNPKIDLETGLIRTQITLNVAVPGTVKTIDQYLTDSVKGTTTVPTQITLPSNIDYNGEALLRDGDTIIIGGQVEENDQDTGGGLWGYDQAGPLAGLIGSTKRTQKVQTYYLVLTAKVYERM